MRNWQARLAMKQDRIKRKIIDLQIEHEGVPTDCIRIRLKKDDEGDIQTRTIEMADVIPAHPRRSGASWSVRYTNRSRYPK